ncbi:MAG: polysaccharide deacetylase family protein [Bacteroidales bacterium]|nr:polysaccharide deacetylase family protein [Bacteroidales bacterium]
MLIQIFSEQNSTRLEYTLDLVFNRLLGHQFQQIFKPEAIDFSQPILNYSKQEIKGSIQMKPHDLLFEDDIKVFNVEVGENGKFFETGSSDFSNDLFSMIFYMASRYEEYNSKLTDKHGRYLASESLAFRQNWLKKAYVHRWADDIKTILLTKYPNINFEKRSYRFINTIDIDNAFAYKAKGVKRLWGGLLKSIIRKDKDDIKHRIKYIFTGAKDPFDVYDELESWLLRYKAETYYFFLVGENGLYDKNISIARKAYRAIINRLKRSAIIGLHPSYQSNASIDILKKEKGSLSDVVAYEITESRQHFLKLYWPTTYRNLIESGIKKDFTLGYAETVGFRSGICIPYPFFDLTTNTSTNLILYPFQIMDGTLNDYMHLTPDEAKATIKYIYDEVKSVGGMFITLWHNESLSEMRQWKNWKDVYLYLLKLATQQQ